MKMYRYETELWKDGFKRVMGLDEVGRGCLSGPVVAAGVIIKPGTKLDPAITDSKKLSDQKRRSFVHEIKEKSIFWTIQQCSPGKIDEINILKASILAMIKCSEQKKADPDYLLVDGNQFSTTLIPHKCIVKGDDNSASIAAASILAKVYRDDIMVQLHEKYPYYGWESNVGYPTAKHFEGLEKYGYTEHHRKSFKLRTEKKFSETDLPVNTE